MTAKSPVPGLDPLTEMERRAYAQSARVLAGAEPVEPLDVVLTAEGARVLCWIEIQREDLASDGSDYEPGAA